MNKELKEILLLMWVFVTAALLVEIIDNHRQLAVVEDDLRYTRQEYLKTLESHRNYLESIDDVFASLDCNENGEIVRTFTE